MRQTMGYPHQDIPSAPPVDMRATGRLTPQEVISAMLGTDILLYWEEGEYATYRHTYLMPPLTGVRTPTRRSADMPSSSRARAASTPSSSRAGTSRGGGGLVPPIPLTYHHAGWPDIPTELTGWRYRSSYPISIEPPMPDHRHVSDPDSPPVCSTAFHLSLRYLGIHSVLDDLSLYVQPPREYMEGMLRLVASLEGMVLRREAQLSIMGFQVLFNFLAFIILLMTCRT